jgi:hypothetical protein
MHQMQKEVEVRINDARRQGAYPELDLERTDSFRRRHGDPE